MKKAILLLLVSVLLMQCSEEINNNDNILQIEGTHLKIDEIKNYLPKEYFSELKLVYIDENGNEKVLNIQSVESIDERELKGMKYTSGSFKVTLYDEGDLYFQIVLHGSANYSNDGKSINKGLSAWLMPFNESGTTWARLRFEDGKPSFLWGDDFREEIVLFSKVFNDVLVTIGKNNLQEQYEKYSELILNSEVGIVAFRDEHNELWVFDRFEE